MIYFFSEAGETLVRQHQTVQQILFESVSLSVSQTAAGFMHCK